MRACGGEVKKCLTTDQNVLVSSPTMHLCVCADLSVCSSTSGHGMLCTVSDSGRAGGSL